MHEAVRAFAWATATVVEMRSFGAAIFRAYMYM
jgi:hypothetical protein